MEVSVGGSDEDDVADGFAALAAAGAMPAGTADEQLLKQLTHFSLLRFEVSFTLGTKHTGSRRFPTAWPLTICGMVLQVEVLLTTSTMVYVEKHS